MNALTVIAFAASIMIIVTYATMVMGHNRKAFDWANALGGIPIIASEVAVGAWPAFVLTVAFCAVGWIGVALSAPGRRRDLRASEETS